MKKEKFGFTADGQEAVLYTIENEKGMRASITDYGAALVKLEVPDQEGTLRDVVLGYDDVAGYEKGDASFGAPVGRCANRIGGASFVLNGTEYALDKNDNGKNTLHSGNDRYNKRFWQVEKEEEQSVTFVLESPDKDQGFPGMLDMHVTYSLTDEGDLDIRYYAVPDQDTVINMTNHSYFNLHGHKGEDILDHLVSIDSDAFTRADKESIPTGEIVDVTDTPMDFRAFHKLGERIDADYEATVLGNGYDHNWVLKNDGEFAKVAEVICEESGIVMEVWTDLPGMQMYTANFLDGEKGKDGAVYDRRSSVCFETQYFPDAVHHENFKSPVCKAQNAYKTKTRYRFYKVQ